MSVTEWKLHLLLFFSLSLMVAVAGSVGMLGPEELF